jgi:two-component system, OmpR family, sensor histidine kinase SenX3
MHGPNRVVLLALPVGLTALLIVLAVLQYRWVGELSENERRRMEATLRASLTMMAGQLTEQLAPPIASISIAPDDLQQLNGERIAADWRRWKAGAIAPELIASIRIARPDGEGRLELHELDRVTGALRQIRWDETNESLASLLEADLSGGGLDQRRWLEDPPGVIIGRTVQFPAIAGASQLDLSELVRQIGQGQRPAVLGYLIVELDYEVLRRELMPALVSRFVLDDDYRIALARTATGDPIYVSDGGPVSSPDIAVAVVTERVAPLVVTGRGGADVAAYTMLRDDVAAVLERGAAATAAPASSAGSRWELQAVHRAGSVDAFVDRLRYRNLLIGTTILLVLALGIGVAFIHARRAEALARQQLDFVSVMSHELRTPIAIVNAAAENLARGVVSSSERGREYGLAIGRETGRLAAMVEQVLEFARSRRGEASTHDLIDLRSVVLDAVAAIAPLAKESAGRITIEGDAEPLLVSGDAEALGRALRNLLGNAIKHSGKAPQVRVTMADSGKDARVTIADQGPGIPPDERSHLTEPFFRGARAIDRQVPGSGLGLAIVRRIVEAHGGRLTIESSDEGSAFTICLPRSRS